MLLLCQVLSMPFPQVLGRAGRDRIRDNRHKATWQDYGVHLPGICWGRCLRASNLRVAAEGRNDLHTLTCLTGISAPLPEWRHDQAGQLEGVRFAQAALIVPSLRRRCLSYDDWTHASTHVAAL